MRYVQEVSWLVVSLGIYSAKIIPARFSCSLHSSFVVTSHDPFLVVMLIAEYNDPLGCNVMSQVTFSIFLL